MRRIWLLLGLCACVESRRSAAYPEYRPELDSESWCRLDAGAFAFEPHPQMAPPLLGHGCTAPHREPAPANAPDGSTFAELVVEPGGAIEIPVQLPQLLQGVGCRIDSVVIPHGKRSSDPAIEIASAGRVVPIVSYEQLPPPLDDGESPRVVVSDGTGLRRAIWVPDAPSGRSTEGAVVVIADPKLWPTGAVLRFDGGRTADGAATVVFEIEKEPEPSSTEEEPAKPEGQGTPAGAPPAGTPPSPAPIWPAPSPAPVGPAPSPAPIGPAPAPAPYGPAPAPALRPFGPAPAPSPAPIGPSPAPIGPSPAPSPSPASSPSPSPAADAQAEPVPPEGDVSSSSSSSSPQPSPLTLIAYRHRIDIAAPDSFSIVLRARVRAFGIGVRSDRESAAPRLLYRAPGAADPAPTHLVPQVGVVVSRCGRPVESVLRDIK